jgi:hypothetical protein
MTICKQCGDSFPIPRYNLGYRTCLSCGDKAAHQVRWCVTIPYSKGAYQVVNPTDLKGLNPKRSEQ